MEAAMEVTVIRLFQPDRDRGQATWSPYQYAVTTWTVLTTNSRYHL